MDGLLHISQRERELIDRREQAGDNGPSILAKINCLRAERGKPPLDHPPDTPPRAALGEE